MGFEEHLEIVAGPTVVQTGTLTSGQPTVTGLTLSALAGALKVTGTGIPRGTLVKSIDDNGQVTLTKNATSSGPSSLTFTLEPVTLEQAKNQCRVDIDDDDAVLALLIASARRRAEVLLRQSILITTYDWFTDGFPSGGGGYFDRVIRQMGPNPQWLPNGAGILYLPKPPLVSVEWVKYYDSNNELQTVDPTTYAVAGDFSGRVQALPGKVWPVTIARIDAVNVRFTAGVANADLVSESTQIGILMLVSFLYENRGEEDVPTPDAIMAMFSADDHGSCA
jgi:hypothetical protein